MTTKIILACVTKNSLGNFKVEINKFNEPNCIASGKYTIGLESIGWDLLAISTNKNYDDETQAEAAGRIEGYLTRERIWNHWKNMSSKWEGKSMPIYIQNFFIEQEKYIEEKYSEDNSDAIYANAKLILTQFKGLTDEYNRNSSQEEKINHIEFHTMTSFGDLFDITYYKEHVERPEFFKWEVEKLLSFILKNNHCSALFKVKEDFSDVFFGHNSWFFYSSTNRIFKEYNFNFNHPSIKSRNVLFSSYPATLGSMDDFYVTSQDLVVIETTNPFFNSELYDKLTPRSLLCWQRSMIANRISTNSKDWAESFSKDNSGTYNNMFMVMDMKKVDLEKNQIQDETFYIVEQIPGAVDINDVTNYLRYGYWPSYNSPFSNKIRNLSHIPEMIGKNPELKHSLDYNTCARANIFRRDQSKANSLEGFKKLIRYNDYKNDPLSFGNPSYTIASRADFKNNCLGAYDGKVSSVSMAKGKTKIINIIMGPTNDNQTSFNWSKSDACKNEPHFGLPDEYNFSWYQYKNEFVDELVFGSKEKKKVENLEFLE